MEKENNWLDQLAEERAAVDPEFAMLNRRAEMMLQLLPLRKELGLTQEDIASRMGVSRAIVGMIESRPRKVSLDRIAAYADVLGARIEIVLPKRTARKGLRAVTGKREAA